MTDPRSQLRLGVVSSVLLLPRGAGVALLGNFADVPLQKSWAAVPASLGLSLILGGFIELGLGLGGLFLLVLLFSPARGRLDQGLWGRA